TFEISEEKYDDVIPKGSIISQSPLPNSEMKVGDKVSVVISKGKEEKPPKDVTRDITIEYNPIIPGQRQRVLIYIEDMTYSMTEPAEDFEITSTTRVPITLKIPFNGKGGYRVQLDDRVIAQETLNYQELE
ncbi:MAG: serine/threonine protein kinase, partial [Neobacillus sp.]|nr:serine/threonine protein kinase [Neobacillus sp.]